VDSDVMVYNEIEIVVHPKMRYVYVGCSLMQIVDFW